MIHILYGIITLISTFLGSVTGMGGGVILKPVFDLFRAHDIQTINILSNFAVFSMSLAAVIKMGLTSKNTDTTQRIEIKTAFSLSIGAVIGGFFGGFVLDLTLKGLSGNLGFIIQNSILSLLIVIIFVFMGRKNRKTLQFNSWSVKLIVGLILGFLASFLGIGGGPFNVAIIIFMFSQPTKNAIRYSLIIILFSQSAKIIMLLINNSLTGMDFSLLYYIIPTAIIGSLCGGFAAKRLNETKTIWLFNGVQILVFLICIMNILRSVVGF